VTHRHFFGHICFATPIELKQGELKQEWRDHLSKHGYTVFRNVATPEQIQKATALYWEYMEAACHGVRRDDPATWTNARWAGIYSVGMNALDAIGQAPLMWYIRTIPAIRAIFGAYFQTDDLLASFDGLGVVRGAEYATEFNRTWLHADQNPKNLKRKFGGSIQGLLQLSPSVLDDGTTPASAHDTGSFVCIPGSHTLFADRVAQGKEDALTMTPKGNVSANNFLRLPEDHFFYKQVQAGQLPLHLLQLAQGDFLVWNSCLVHSGWAPTTTAIKHKLRRLVAYVTMAPAANATKEVRAARLEAVKAGVTTGHWTDVMPRQTHAPRPRHKSFQPIKVPPACKWALDGSTQGDAATQEAAMRALI